MVLKVQSAKLRQLREAAGYSQLYLAMASECTLGTIARSEEIDCEIRLRTAIKIARALKCRVEDFTEKSVGPKGYVKKGVKRGRKPGIRLDGHRVRDLRWALKLPQIKLAEAVDTTTQTIGEIERNVKRVSVRLGGRVAKALGCELNDIMTEDENDEV